MGELKAIPYTAKSFDFLIELLKAFMRIRHGERCILLAILVNDPYLMV
jgi:hypothetical protein